LSTNYRSPAEVFDLAAQVISRSFPQADLPAAVRRTGIEPELLVAPPDQMAETVATAVARLLGRVAGTVGLVTPEFWSEALLRALAERSLDANRVVVMDPITVKGLEYDAVVVADPDRIVAESSGRERTLYVCLTRPTQRLVTVDVGQPGAWRPAAAGPGGGAGLPL
ncbi:MAG: ATP-binding domain-containing protein, partial [Propionibacteriaceae bacterium]|nr:ATP-binding domain-containing protein [Propionibacteriaceae bacterium]